MRQRMKVGLLLLVLLTCVGCDQVTKSVARDLLASSDRVSLLDDLVVFEYVENPGGFLSMGAALPGHLRFLLFSVFAGAAVALLLVLLMRTRRLDPALFAGIAIFMGGAIGNLIDRIFNDGRVVDFVSIGIGALRTGIFNLADVAIMAGAVIVMAWLIKPEKLRTEDAGQGNG